jgi:hypothetical protein
VAGQDCPASYDAADDFSVTQLSRADLNGELYLKAGGKPMAIRWSAVKVSQKVDEIEELMNSIKPTLWQIREKAEELRSISNLPGYIDQPTATMTFKVDNFKNYMKGWVERIRRLIPEQELEDERKALEYGSQQSLV